MNDEARTPGVYRLGAEGNLMLVHEYLDDGYELAEISEALGIGSLGDNGSRLRLDDRERRLLEVTAHAQSFDHAPEFISMCLDIAALEVPPDSVTIELVSLA